MTKPTDNKAAKGDNGRSNVSTKASRQILDRVERESETIGTSGLARTADKTARDLSSGYQAEDDPIELWGKRIGRGLGAVVVVYLIYHLATTYVLNG